MQDFGTGIDKKYQRKIFDLFFRAEMGEKKRTQGLGVGLYIASQIIKKHQGKIWVNSKKGEGSTFYFTFPLSPRQKI